jgi:hypothetical protein
MRRTDGWVSPLTCADTNGVFQFTDPGRGFGQHGFVAPARFKGVDENLDCSPASSRFGRVPAWRRKFNPCATRSDWPFQSGADDVLALGPRLRPVA